MMTNLRDDLDRGNDGVLRYYLDNEQTTNHHSLTFALRELNETEADEYCQNLSSPVPRVDGERQFTSNYRLRLYHSGCHYLDDNHRWRSDGIRVSDDRLLLYHLRMIRWDHWLTTLGHNAWLNTWPSSPVHSLSCLRRSIGISCCPMGIFFAIAPSISLSSSSWFSTSSHSSTLDISIVKIDTK